MDSADVISIVGTTTSATGASLTGSLPLVLGIFAALTGLGIALHYVKRYIGRKG